MSLPEGLKFLQFGWWVVHLLAVLWLYSYAYRKGRRDEQKAQRLRDITRLIAKTLGYP